MTDSNLKPGDLGYENVDAPLEPVNDPEIINKIAELNSKLDHLVDTMNIIVKKLNDPDPEYVVDVKGDITLRPRG